MQFLMQIMKQTAVKMIIYLGWYGSMNACCSFRIFLDASHFFSHCNYLSSRAVNRESLFEKWLGKDSETETLEKQGNDSVINFNQYAK